jgi:hypothetical protein
MDMRMPRTAAEVHLPKILRNRSSHLVKLNGKIDSFSLLLRETHRDLEAASSAGLKPRPSGHLTKTTESGEKSGFSGARV